MSFNRESPSRIFPCWVTGARAKRERPSHNGVGVRFNVAHYSGVARGRYGVFTPYETL